MELELTTIEENYTVHKCKGLPEKQIADKCYRSVHAVKQALKRAMKRNNISNGFELVARYAAAHPEIFRNLIVVICMTAQSISMFSDYRDDFKRGRKYQTKKLSRIRKSSRSKAFKLAC